MTKKGGGTLQIQIDRIKAGLSEIEIAEAEKLALKKPEVVKLAFKLIDKTKSGLSKKDQTTFDELHAIDPKVAEEWKSKKLK